MPKSRLNICLSIREELFCWHYLTDFNATAACIRAGYSPKTATICASQLLQKAKIRHKIHEITRWRIRKLTTAIFDGDVLCAYEQAILPVNPLLSDKEQSFVNHYMQCFNATEAAACAGYVAKNRKTMGVIATRLLEKPNILAKIENVKNEMIRQISICQGIALRKAARVAFGDISRVCEFVPDSSGIPRLVIQPDATTDDWAAVKEVRHVKGGFKVRMRDKYEPLEFLMQSLGMLDEFGLALKTLEENGLVINQDKNSEWSIIDLSKNVANFSEFFERSQAKNDDTAKAA